MVMHERLLLDDNLTLDNYVEQAAPCIALQAQIVWPALNDGYVEPARDI
jgi:hypothetical protein